MSQRRFYALGTASQVPTRERNHNGYMLRWDDEGLLFDPGEGTQRQMIFSSLSASQITKIFITHFHGDHCLGLAGLFQRLSLDRVAHKVQLFYPESGTKFVSNLRNASIYHDNADIEEIAFSEDGIIFQNDKFYIEAVKLDHTVETFGYRLVEKDTYRMAPKKLDSLGIFGKDIAILKRDGLIEINGKIIKAEECGSLKKGQVFAFVMDTRICEGAHKLAENADLLVCESTYLESEREDAIKNGHLTASQAAGIAKRANARQLVLTHFSQRYLFTNDFLAEAQKIYENCRAVKDGDFIDLPRN